MNKENLVFMDGEFAKLKPNGIDLLSIGLIKQTGEELYLEMEFKGEIDSWVKENVFPHLKKEKVSKEEAIKLIKDFIGDKKPYLVSYINQFDWMGICNLFNTNTSEEIKNNLPFHWVPIDFASILFEKGVEPKLSLMEIGKIQGINISDIQEHNALDDARLLKRIYNQIKKKKKKTNVKKH